LCVNVGLIFVLKLKFFKMEGFVGTKNDWLN
jgi:hypothetical protein